MSEIIGTLLIVFILVGPAASYANLYKAREENRKAAEKKRIEDILSHQNEWGGEFCKWLIVRHQDTAKPPIDVVVSKYRESGVEMFQWLIEGQLYPVDPGVAGILAKLEEWGPERCKDLLQRATETSRWP